MTQNPQPQGQMTIADFINQTTPGHICPFCGNRQWTLIGERGFLKPNAQGEFTVPSEVDKAFLTECMGCGFVRMIRPYNLIQRIAAQQQGTQQSMPPPPRPTDVEASEFSEPDTKE